MGAVCGRAKKIATTAALGIRPSRKYRRRQASLEAHDLAHLDCALNFSKWDAAMAESRCHIKGGIDDGICRADTRRRNSASQIFARRGRQQLLSDNCLRERQMDHLDYR